MTESRRTDGVLAGLQQLCGLSLSSEMAMPELLNALPRWIPADAAQFFWVDAGLQPTHYFCSTAHLDAAEEFAGRSEDLDIPGMPSFSSYLRRHASMTHGGPEDPGYFRSVIYNEVIRPTGTGESLICAVVRDVAGQPRGSISLGRSKRHHPFTAQERRGMEMLARHVGQIFSPAAEALAWEEECRDAQGTALLDPQGQPTHCDETARRLLFLAGHPGFATRAMARLHGEGVAHQLRRLCMNLGSLFAGRPAAPAACSIRLPSGRFVFRARRLAASRNPGADPGLIGLDITHYLPRRVVVWRRLQELNLPARLQQVCLEFAAGRSMTEIAEQLGISRHTVIDHVNRIYERFGLEPGREALQEYLLGSR